MPSCLADRAQESQHCLGGGRIEARDGLVGKDQRRLLRERAGDADALLLAAGQLIDARERLVRRGRRGRGKQSASSRSARGSGNKLRSVPVEGEPPGEHVVERAVPLDQLVLLEDRRGAPPVLAQQGRGTEHAEFARDDAPGGGRHQVIDRTQQGRFSRPRAAEQDHELATMEGDRWSRVAPSRRRNTSH